MPQLDVFKWPILIDHKINFVNYKIFILSLIVLRLISFEIVICPKLYKVNISAISTVSQYYAYKAEIIFLVDIDREDNFGKLFLEVDSL